MLFIILQGTDGGSYVVDNNIYAQIQYKINDLFSLTLGGGLKQMIILLALSLMTLA